MACHNWLKVSGGRIWRDIRGSVHVKLMAVLDVEHEVPSVQILHHKEEVLLDTEMHRGQDSEWMSPAQRPGHRGCIEMGDVRAPRKVVWMSLHTNTVLLYLV